MYYLPLLILLTLPLSPVPVPHTCVCKQNRGREVAIATMSPTRTHILQVFVCQDSQSYAETIDLLLELRPKEILLHDGTRNKVGK